MYPIHEHKLIPSIFYRLSQGFNLDDLTYMFFLYPLSKNLEKK